MRQVDEEQELTRLLAQESSPLASGLSALRDRGPDASELASLASRLALQGLNVSLAAPRPRPNRWKKWALGGVGGASAIVVWLALRGAPAREATLSVQPLAASSAPSRPAVKHLGSPQRPPSAAAGSRTPIEVSTPPAASSRAIASGAVSSALVREPRSPIASGSARAEDVHGSNERVSPSSVTSSRASTAATTASASGGPALPLGAATPPSEIELLRDARLALRGSPARALALTEEHARAYPQGKMTQERELIAVSALVALGRRTAALSRAASFERLYPTSPYRKQMGDLLR